jgi:hypothetical protein
MPRYEIIAHVTQELACESAEEAAAVVRRTLLAESGAQDRLLHLAVWRDDPAPAQSALPPELRQTLVDFFATLERRAGEAEAAFREHVAAILSVSAVDAAVAENHRAARASKSDQGA